MCKDGRALFSVVATGSTPSLSLAITDRQSILEYGGTGGWSWGVEAFQRQQKVLYSLLILDLCFPKYHEVSKKYKFRFQLTISKGKVKARYMQHFSKRLLNNLMQLKVQITMEPGVPWAHRHLKVPSGQIGSA
jgi:hypothetical protein